jgi:hypothetical protein
MPGYASAGCGYYFGSLKPRLLSKLTPEDGDLYTCGSCYEERARVTL